MPSLPSVPAPPRRYDIDALRAVAFGPVIVYHLGMVYVADWHWHLKSPHAADWLQTPMWALNLWRMDLVFLISGLAFGLVRRGQTVPGLVRLRSKRLLLPLAFGMAVVMPYQPYAQGVANGLIAPRFGDFLWRYYAGSTWPAGAFDGWEVGFTWNHLWFLTYRGYTPWCWLRCCPCCRWRCVRCCCGRTSRPHGIWSMTAGCTRCTSRCSFLATGSAWTRACGPSWCACAGARWFWPLARLLCALAVCWGLTAVVRRMRWLRPLFGLAAPRTAGQGQRRPD